jgi:WD40 repeat protein
MRYFILIKVFFICIITYAQKIELIESFIGYTEQSEIISFTPNPKLIMSGNAKGSINLWDLEQQKLIKIISAHNAPINDITFNHSKRKFITCSKDSTVKLWSFYTNRLLESIKVDNIPTLAKFNKKGDGYLVFLNDGSVLEKKIGHKEIHYKSKLKQAINDVILTSNPNEIITCDNNAIKVISLNTEKVIHEIKNPYSSNFLKIDRYSGDTLISWSENGMISYWDLNNKSIITEIRAKNAYNKLLINDFAEIILSGYYNDRPLVINLKEIKLEQKYSDNMIVVNTFLSSLDQKYLVSSDIDNRHRLMELKELDFTPLVIQERYIKDEKTFKIKSRYIIINVWDNEKIDGDIISINFNGKWILKNYPLIKEKKTLLLPLNENSKNDLIFHAENVGTIPPNTAAVRLEYDNGVIKDFDINSDFDSNGIIHLIQVN